MNQVSGGNHVVRATKMSYGFSPHQPPLFQGLDVTVPRGAVYGLLGPNGCGKTTFLRLLIGQSRPAEGDLEVLSQVPWQQCESIRSRVALVPQENDLDPRLTVAQTLELLASFYPDHWRRERAVAKLEQLGLHGMLSHRVGSLSVGFRQRLALVTALAMDPELLLLDEPAAGLDEVVRRSVMEAVVDFMAEKPGHSVIFCSHLLSEIEPVIDHVGLLHGRGEEGRMLVEGRIEDIKAKIWIAEVPDSGNAEPLDLEQQVQAEIDRLLAESLDDGPAAFGAVEAGRAELESTFLRQRIRDSKVPLGLSEHPKLLTRSFADPATLVFWLEQPEDRQAVKEMVDRAGGRLIPSSSLDEVFVRLFSFAQPVAGRRVQNGVFCHAD